MAGAPGLSRQRAGHQATMWQEPDGSVRGWSADFMRHVRRGTPGRCVLVVTSDRPGPSVLEVMAIAAHDHGTGQDQEAIRAVTRAAASRDAEVPDPDELDAAGLAPMRLTVPVDGTAAEFTGLRGTGLWCCRAEAGDAAVLIAGIRWPAAITGLVRVDNPIPAGDGRARDSRAADGRLQRAWDEAAREGPPDALPPSGAWSVVVDQPERLIIALHIRDAARLPARLTPPIPPLTPPVPGLAGIDEVTRSAAASQWPRWWQGVVDSVDHPPRHGQPDLADLAGGPELRLLIERDLAGPSLGARAQERVHRHPPSGPGGSRTGGGPPPDRPQPRAGAYAPHLSPAPERKVRHSPQRSASPGEPGTAPGRRGLPRLAGNSETVKAGT